MIAPWRRQREWDWHRHRHPSRRHNESRRLLHRDDCRLLGDVELVRRAIARPLRSTAEHFGPHVIELRRARKADGDNGRRFSLLEGALLQKHGAGRIAFEIPNPGQYDATVQASLETREWSLHRLSAAPAIRRRNTFCSQHPTGLVKEIRSDQRRVINRFARWFVCRLVDYEIRALFAILCPA